MNCKYCQAPLEEENTVCPVCGKEQDASEELQQLCQEETLCPEETEAPEAAEVTEETEETEETEATEATEETAEPAPRKKTWMKVTAAVLCVALLLGLGAGIWYGVNGGFAPRANDLYAKDVYTVEDAKVIKAMDQVVATCNGTALTNSQLQIYYWMQVFSFLENYSYYLSYFGLDYTQPLSQQMMDENTTWEQYFLDMALSSWHRFQAMLIHAQAEGFQMPASVDEYLAQLPQQMEQTAATYGYESVNDLLADDMGAGCDIDDYVYYMGLYAKNMEYMDYLYGELEPTQEEVRAFVEANAEMMMNEYGVSLDSGNLVDIRHVLIQPEGCEFNESNHVVATDEQWEACREKAQGLLDQWLAGTADEEGFSQMAMEHSADGNAASGGIYTDVRPGQMVVAFNDWCFDESRKPGDSGLVRTEFGYHIMYFVGAEEGWLRYGPEAYITQACDELVNKAVEAYPMEVNYKKISIGTAHSLVTADAG